jgi:hypothetical protein
MQPSLESLMAQATSRHFERRREARSDCAAPAYLAIVGRQQLPEPVSVIEMSFSGAKLFSAEPLRVGTMVEITYGMIERTAEVRHCTPTEHGFEIGVLMKDPNEISAESLS